MTQTQVVISFDTTGSMSAALKEVRSRITDMITSLKRDVPGISLSVIAHGDYCDKDIYVTKHVDFTNDKSKLISFVNSVEETGGGDTPECYELVLRLVRTKLSWRRKAQKILVVIGDAYPHEPSYPGNVDKIDWKEEARLLAEMPVRIYGVQIKNDRLSTEFFRLLTRTTGGSHLNLSEFSTLSDVILAICYRTRGTENLKKLETEVRARYAPKPLHKDLEEVFAVLHLPHAKPTVAPKTKSPPGTFRGKDNAFFWSGQLSASQSVSWTEPEDDDSVHKLQLQLATLGATAKAHEVHIVEVETVDFHGRKVKHPIIQMVGGKDRTISVGLSFNSSVKFTLAQGEGPVYLSGQHVAVNLSENEVQYEIGSGGREAKGVAEKITLNPSTRGREKEESYSSSPAFGYSSISSTLRRRSSILERARSHDETASGHTSPTGVSVHDVRSEATRAESEHEDTDQVERVLRPFEEIGHVHGTRQTTAIPSSQANSLCSLI